MSKRPFQNLKDGPPTRRQREQLRRMQGESTDSSLLTDPSEDELDVGKTDFSDDESVPGPSCVSPLLQHPEAVERAEPPPMRRGGEACVEAAHSLEQPPSQEGQIPHSHLSTDFSDTHIASEVSEFNQDFFFDEAEAFELLSDNLSRDHQVLLSQAEEDVFDYFLSDAVPFDGDLPPPPAPSSEQEEALYPGAALTQRESLYSILSFVQSENLTGVGIDKLLKLIDLHLPQPNLSVKSSDVFFRLLGTTDFQFELTHYCSVCWKLRSSPTDICGSCVSRPNRKVDYFVSMPLEPQIRKLLSRPGILDSLKYKDNRQKSNPSNFDDLYDGSVYKSAEEKFVNENITLTLMWYTDGLSLYECSAYSLWPFFFVVNELPPSERFKRENIIMAGLWGCHSKPHPNFFLKKTCIELMKLRDGIDVTCEGTPVSVCVDVVVVCGTCDAPAKADFLNLKSYAGFFSCSRCLIKGEKSEETENVMVFPHENVLVSRTDENYKEHLNETMKDEKGEACMGVKGPTILSHMVSTSILSSTAIDGMHCLYLGVQRQICNLIFNSKFSKEPYSLHSLIESINNRISSIQIPHFVQRTLLPVDKLSFWKASLCRNFLLYIMLLVLKGIMKIEQYENLTDLVVGVSLLNSTSVSANAIVCAREHLSRFCENFQRIYGKRNMSSNVHALRHLADQTEQLGPLWVTSCFPFEDLNGKLANLAHGTRHAGLQIANNLSIFSELNVKIAELQDGAAKTFCETMTQKSKRLQLNPIVSKSMHVIGKRDSLPVISDCLEQRLHVVYEGNVTNYCTFSRLYFNQMVYVSSAYKRGSRVSSYVKYGDGSASMYGEILTFVEVFSPMKAEPDVLALVKQFEVAPFCNNIRHIFKVLGFSAPKLMLADELQCVCFKVVIDNDTYVSVPLNPYELE